MFCSFSAFSQKKGSFEAAYVRAFLCFFDDMGLVAPLQWYNLRKLEHQFQSLKSKGVMSTLGSILNRKPEKNRYLLESSDNDDQSSSIFLFCCHFRFCWILLALYYILGKLGESSSKKLHVENWGKQTSQ